MPGGNTPKDKPKNAQESTVIMVNLNELIEQIKVSPERRLEIQQDVENGPISLRLYVQAEDPETGVMEDVEMVSEALGESLEEALLVLKATIDA